MYCFKKIRPITHRIGNSYDMRSVPRFKSYSIALEHLKHRSLLRLQGIDSATFLQGLITNDVKHFDQGSKSLYAMFLNASGRVFCDSLIYREASTNSFLIECDSDIVENLRRHLNLYRVRKQIDISISEYLVWAAFSPEILEDSLCVTTKQDEKIVTFCEDPRSKHLGYRLIVNRGVQEEFIKKWCFPLTNIDNKIKYHEQRYTLGIGEGIVDFPPGKCFPMECNCDFLHGISFHKGCYIGQELTARTHHTGIIRKRLMPLAFEALIDQNLEDAEVSLVEGTVVGKLRGKAGRAGLGLLRIEKVIDKQRLIVGNKYFCTVYRPCWWPKEIHKNI
ncbi:putative transferase CAF17 homolog, mitochondrial [Sabethes cyaneus]|uniref:putative transferase CAF17 homolog, mitochondrial n=1 Tax=Sabethes cyaneus TaxID=53552 RepID=UPI00237DCC90|nr:putative transferase CAF17 homolog, mitochondrial [Sabethes cyaneus]